MKKILVALAAALAITASAYAQSYTQIVYKQETSEIEIGISGIEKNPALISIVKGKYDPAADFAERDYVFFKELYADDTVTCRLSDSMPSGEYTIVTVVNAELETKSLWHMNEAAASKAIGRIKAAGSAAEVKGIIAAEHSTLGIDYDEFILYADEISEYFFKLFLGTDKTAQDFRNAYYSAYAIAKAKHEGVEAAEQLLMNYSTELGVPKETYNSLSDDTKSVFLKLFSSGNITQNNINDQMTEYLFLAEVNTEKAWKSFERLVIEKYSIFLGIDTKKLTENSQRESIIKSLMQKVPYSAARDFVTEYNNAAAVKPVSDTGSVSGGGGGGSGSGGGGGVSTSNGYVSTAAGDQAQKPVSAYEGAAAADPDSPFSDVSPAHWAYESIMRLYKRGIINGVEKNSFKPENNITRAEFAALTARLFYPGEKAEGSIPADISANDWYYEPVILLCSKGILLGDENGRINPEETITRQDVCVILSRILGLSPTIEMSFNDKDDISGYAADAVAALNETGIVNGREDNRFEPKEKMTRAETSAVLYRLTEKGLV